MSFRIPTFTSTSERRVDKIIPDCPTIQKSLSTILLSQIIPKAAVKSITNKRWKHITIPLLLNNYFATDLKKHCNSHVRIFKLHTTRNFKRTAVIWTLRASDVWALQVADAVNLWTRITLIMTSKFYCTNQVNLSLGKYRIHGQGLKIIWITYSLQCLKTSEIFVACYVCTILFERFLHLWPSDLS